MRKQFVVFLAVISILTVLTPFKSYASENTDDISAALSPTTTPVVNQQADRRVTVLEAYLESYNSPLAPYAQTLINDSDKYNLPWELIPAISGVESNFGENIPAYSYNGWGFGIYGNNVLRFQSWPDAIAAVSCAIRTEYIEKNNAQNIYQIGNMYASDPTWAYKVRQYMNGIDTFSQQESTNNSLPIAL